MAQDTSLEKAWNLFENDSLEMARAAFKEMVESPDKAKAYLGLSLVDAAMDENSDESFDSHYNFYKTSKNPQPYIVALWSLDRSDRKAKEVTYLEEVAAREKGYLKVMAYQSLGYHYRSKGDFSKAQSYFAKTGALKNWQLVGEFENISESGFDADFGVLEHPEMSYIFKNKRGADVKWFKLKDARYDNWIDFDYNFYINNSIIYAQTFVNSPSDQEVEFRVGTSGSLKFWANDNLLFQESEERNNGLDTYIFTGRLKKGYNRLLLQIGSSDINNSNFLVRITDKDGENINGLSTTNETQAYSKDDFKSVFIPNPAEEFFYQKIEASPDNMENYLILAQLLLRNDKTYDAKKILLSARKKFPKSSYLLFQILELYQRDDNRTMLSTYLDELKTKFPDRALAQEIMYSEAKRIDDLDRCDELLEIISDREGDSKNVYTKRIELAAARDKTESMIQILNAAYARYPDVYSFVYLKSLVEKEVKKSPASGVKVLEKYTRKHFNADAEQQTANYYFQMGNASKGIKIYQTLSENNPIAVGYLKALSDIYFTMQNYKMAKVYLDKCLEIAPYVGQYYQGLGKIYAAENKTSDAIESYKLALRYNPYDYDTNEALRKAEGKPAIFSIFKATDAYQAFAEAAPADSFPEDNSLLVLNESQNVVYKNGGSELRREILVKIFNTSGVDDWKQYTIPTFSNQKGRVEKAEVIKANGAKIDAQQNGVNLVFENLEPGDGIHILYRLQNYNSGKLSNQFWDKFYLAYFFPIGTSRYSLFMPDGKEFKYDVENLDLEPTIEDVDGGKIYVWERKNTPSLQEESYMPEMVDFSPVLHISTIPDWTYVADWYSDLAYAKTKVNYEVAETVNDLFANDSSLTDLAKAEKIYNYIVSNIRYSSVSFIQSGLVPQKASEVINTKQGDCKDVSTLFVAMCKAQGIDANLVLVNSRDNGIRDMTLPSIDFNHCIAHTVLDGKKYYLELTDDNLPFSSSYASVNHSFVLDIPAVRNRPSEAMILDNSENRVKNDVFRQSNVRFDGDDMLIVRNNQKTGVNASRMRSWMKNMGQETRIKEMQDAVSADFPEAKVSRIEFLKGLNTVNSKVEYEYDFRVPSVFTEISGLSIFKVPLTDFVSNLPFMSNEDRQTNLELWNVFNAETYNETVSIELPAGRTTDIPTSKVYNSDYLNYALNISRQGNKVVVERSLKVLKDQVPKEDFEAFKIQCRNIIKADDLRLGLK